jgi:hypothetical protein
MTHDPKAVNVTSHLKGELVKRTQIVIEQAMAEA